MNIIYTVCGIGFGHSSRARELTEYLQSKGHTVTIVSSGKSLKALQDLHPIEIRGAEFSFKEGRVRVLASTVKTLQSAGTDLKNLPEILRKVRANNPDLVLTDMEPLGALLSKALGLPLVSCDNQHRLTHATSPIPSGKRKEFLLAKAVVTLAVPFAKEYLIFSFAENTPLKRKKGKLLRPLIRKAIRQRSPKEGTYYVAYLSEENDAVLNRLRNSSEEWRVYGYEKEGKEGNILFRKVSHEGFAKDLAGARGIVGTAGFSAIAEALYLKKPYLAIPIKNHFEQRMNAQYLRESGYGDYVDEITQGSLTAFIQKRDHYKQNLNSYENNVEKTLDGIEKELLSLSKKNH